MADTPFQLRIAAILELRTMIDAIQKANHAQEVAITGAIEANRAALRLLRDQSGA